MTLTSVPAPGADPGALTRALRGFSALESSGWLDDRYTRDLGRLATVPARYADALTDHPAVAAWAEQVLFDFPVWLLLQGPTGTGKTHQAYAAIRIILAAGGWLWDGGTEAELIGQVRRLWPSAEAESLIDEYAAAPLLLVDDLGAAKGSEWTEEVLYRVLNRRYEAMLPTLITSNLPTGQLGAHLGDRVASRITEAAARVVLAGPDRRRSA